MSLSEVILLLLSCRCNNGISRGSNSALSKIIGLWEATFVIPFQLLCWYLSFLIEMGKVILLLP